MAGTEVGRGAVLYVEDDESDVLFMRRAFSREGLDQSLQTVDNGQAAIDYLSGTGRYAERDSYPVPKLVVLDINLPVLSGFEVLQWMREHPNWRGLPVVMFSASPRQEDHNRALSLGANEYFEKPNSGLLFSQIVRGLKERWL